MDSAFRSMAGRTKRLLLLALLGGGVTVAASQLSCAEVQADWPFTDGSNGDGGSNNGDGGGPWHCYTGSPTNEPQLLNHCTEADPINRPSNIPATTWDGKSPLPGTQ
jgi:hypothetical protein